MKDADKSERLDVNKFPQEAIGQLEHEYGILKDIEDYRAGRLETVPLDELKKSLGLVD